VSAIKWREQQRNYVMDIQATWSATNAPMIAPLWLLFPGESACAFTSDGQDNVACSGSFMFGPDWLAKPVTQYSQTSSWVWLPTLPSGESWVYWFDKTNYGRGGVNVTLSTPISTFPLFYRQSA